jgi:uncharacterized membrane protein
MLFDLIAELFSTSPTSAAEALLNGSAVSDHPFMSFILVAVFCFLFGAVVAAVYALTKRDEPLSWNFVLTIAIMPGVVAMLTALVHDNLARALGLAGIFTLVRFRSTSSDPKDLACVVSTMAIGVAGGLKLLAYAGVAAGLIVVFFFLSWLVSLARGNTRTRCKLKITVPENMAWDKTFDEVLKNYARHFALARIKTVEQGSFFELHYDVTLKQGVNEKELIDEIRTRNGNLTVLMNKRPDSTYDPM